MTKIDFYILATQHALARWEFAVRLLDKIFVEQQGIYVYCNNEDEAKQFDEMLWTKNDIEFIPHMLFRKNDIEKYKSTPILIGTTEPPESHQNILLNCHFEVPEFFSGFQRILEIVPSIDNYKQMSRQHFKHYREQGCEIETHEIR